LSYRNTEGLIFLSGDDHLAGFFRLPQDEACQLSQTNMDILIRDIFIDSEKLNLIVLSRIATD
jgi:hypothetical protein